MSIELRLFTGRTGLIAARLVEAAFPAGERLPRPNCQQLLGATEALLANHPAGRRVVTGLLWWLETRCFATHGQSFSSADTKVRGRFLREIQEGLPGGAMLRLLTLPFRIAYLSDTANLACVDATGTIPTPRAVEQARWHSQIQDAEDIPESEQNIECDVVVVGTGAGGAAAAYELACRGLAVVLVEEGRYHTRQAFNGNPADVIPKLYRAMGSTTAMGSNPINIPIGRSVGGTTTINAGTCLRTPDNALADWCAEGLVDFTPEEMAPWFDQVENLIQVRPADVRHIGEIGATMTTGARRIGMKEMRPMTRNAEGCDGQGMCLFGCPTDAKQSTNISFVPAALRHGAFLYTGFRAEQLLRDGRMVSGVVARGSRSDGKPVTLKVRAQSTVIAMGALLTPNFLRTNGIRSDWLGNNLSIHPAGVVTAWFPDRNFGNSHTITQGFGIFDYERDGLAFEGCTQSFLHHGLLTSQHGDDFVRFAERYQQTAYFGFMMKDSSRGKVRRGPSHDLPLILYQMNDADFARFKHALDLLARMYFAAGAREVCFPGPTRMTVCNGIAELEAFWATDPKRHHFLVTAYHPLGTARISASPDKGVCDTNHRVWGLDGLYVMDGAAVPGPLGVNPQITIMAMAMRAAYALANRLCA